jgi:hypothetical protein
LYILMFRFFWYGGNKCKGTQRKVDTLDAALLHWIKVGCTVVGGGEHATKFDILEPWVVWEKEVVGQKSL